MKLFKKKELMDDLVYHQYSNAYEDNPNYYANLNFFHFSKDSKLIAGYWEAPKGWFKANIKDFNEINFIIHGVVAISLGNKKVVLKEGDCFLLEDGDKVKIEIIKELKTFFCDYPIDEKFKIEAKKIMNSKYND